MKIKQLFVCTAVLLSCGCSSYRFASESRPNGNIDVKGRYRIAHITISGEIGIDNNIKAIQKNNPFAVIDPWSIPQVAMRYPYEDLRQMVIKKYPNVFADNPALPPIDIIISCNNEYKERVWTILFPYLVSLGTLPAFYRTTSDCTVEIRPTSSMMSTSSRSVRFVSDGKLTVFTPFGLIPFDSMPSDQEQRLGSGVMSAPHLDETARRHLLEVFANTVADLAIEQIKEAESKALIVVHSEKPVDKCTTAEPPQPSNLVNGIEQLIALRDSGVITEQEFLELSKRAVYKRGGDNEN